MATTIPNVSGRLFHTNGKVATRAELTDMIIHGQNPLLINPRTGYCDVLVPSAYKFDNDGLVSAIGYMEAIINIVE